MHTMKKSRCLIILSIVCCLTLAASGQQHPTTLQTGFRENAGQVTDQFGKARNDIQFQLSMDGCSVFIGDGKIHYQWNEQQQQITDDLSFKTGRTDSLSSYQPPVLNSYRLDVTLLGANPKATAVKEELMPDVDIYYSGGLNGVQAHSFQKITFRNIYPHIDWVFYCKENTLKYDFIIHPGGKASDIQLKYEGATAMAIHNGAMTAHTPMGSLTEQKPYSYTLDNSKTVTSGFVLKNDILSFDIGTYEGTLVIDPELRLQWGTYYGGSGSEAGIYLREHQSCYDTYGQTTTTDHKGNIYLNGTTESADNIATTGTYQTSITLAGGNAYLVKFNTAGQRIWATYFGGININIPNINPGTVSGRGHAIACDTLGNIYMAGNTFNDGGIATPGAYQTTIGGLGWPDLYLVKFHSDGMREWSTYLGNPWQEGGGSVAVTPDGSKIYLAGAGTAYSGTLDVIASANASIPGTGGGSNRYAGFLTCFNPAGQRTWGTYVGNTADITSTVYDMAMDHEGSIFLTGYAIGESSVPNLSLSSPGSHQPSFSECPLPPGPPPGGYWLIRPVPDAFLQKWDGNGNKLWGTYYGGSGLGGANAPDGGYAVTCDEEGNVYMAGFTSPFTCGAYGPWTVATQGSFMDTYPAENGGSFLVKFSGTGQRDWGTYFYGTSTALASKDDQVFLLTNTAAAGIATPCAYQTENQSMFQTGTSQTCHLSVFGLNGQQQYATYFGGKMADEGYSLAVDTSEEETALYIAGNTFSASGIATPGSFKSSLGNQLGIQRDAFLAKFTVPAARRIIVPCFSLDSVLITATDTSGTGYVWTNGDEGYSTWINASGSYVVNYQQKNGCPKTDTFLVTINPLPLLSTENRCKGESTAATQVAPGNKNTYIYKWYAATGLLLQTTESDQGDAISGLEAGTYTVQILADDCDTTLHFTIENLPGVVLTVSNDTLIAAGASIRLRASGALSYLWSPVDWLDNPKSQTPVASPQAPITYTVTGFNEFGCKASRDIHIAIDETIFMPNAFSPNGDGINDVFMIGNFGYHKLSEFRIFNRWGEEIFNTTNPSQGWNGLHKGQPADMGIYHYYIRLYNTGGEEKVFRGSVTLVR